MNTCRWALQCHMRPLVPKVTMLSCGAPQESTRDWEHTAGEASATCRPQDAAEMRAVSQQTSGVSWLLMGTGDGVYIWEPPKGSAPCLDDTAFAQSHRSHCHDAASCGKRCPVPQGSFVPASNSLSLPQTCFSASSYALPTPTRLLRTDFISALSMWPLYSNEIHRNDRANLCSGIANEFSVF